MTLAAWKDAPAMSLRRQLLAVCVVVLATLVAAPLLAAEPPAGSKNFSAPRSVPDYFSNESGPLHTGANAPAARPGPAPRFAAPATHRATSVAAHRHAPHRTLRTAAASRHHPDRRRYRRLARRTVGGQGHALHGRAAHGGQVAPTLAAHERHETAHRNHEPAHRLSHGLPSGKTVAARHRHRPASRAAKRLVRVRG